MYGSFGRVLRVDLSTPSVSVVTVPEEIYRKFFAGSGLAAELWLRESRLSVDPLGPDNAMVVVAGLLTGTPALTASRASVVAKSPLQGILTESTVGGHWPAMLKATGFDGIIIAGRAEKPVYLWVTEETAEIRDASDLWGKDTYAVAEALEALAPRVQVASIGPGGENLVRFASIMAGGHQPRAAGRTGMGAVMGAKNLKAIAVSGSKRPAVADLARLQALTKEAVPTVREYTKMLYNFGTAGGVPSVELSGDLAIENWRRGSWKEGAAKTSGQWISENILTGHYACTNCPIRCGKVVELKTGPHQGTIAHGPEYETCAGFGAMCLNDDANIVAAANDLCNRYGIDTITASSMVAFAFEAAEKGVINEPGLTWGNGEAILRLVEDMSLRRTPLGRILGHGAREAARILGKNSSEFTIECKGLEVAYHDPRAFTSMAVNYATANRGGCHLEGLTYFVEGGALPGSYVFFEEKTHPHGWEHKAALARRMQDYLATFNPLGMCKFLIRGRVGIEILASWISAVTGWSLTPEELLQTGERLFNRRRMLNVALGLSRKDDTLSPRLLTLDRKTGGAAGCLPNLGKMLGEYYELRGWSEDGIPTPEKLAELGLRGVAEVGSELEELAG